MIVDPGARPPTLRSDAADGRAALERTSERLRAERLHATSTDGLVTVTVDGFGELLGVELDAGVLPASTARALGQSTVEAVTAARAVAAERCAEVSGEDAAGADR
jgi:DNA-binding protein YbaB